MTTPPPASPLGIVVIGRNEGERLRACLASVVHAGPVVYVDSGSTDDSVAAARALGAHVVPLDLSVPFTAARARNAGFRALAEVLPGLAHVQFVDGDCEVTPGWVEAAAAFLDAHPDTAAVCGRRYERFPQASIYNAMCHREWDTPIGPADAVGGDALYRAEAFRAAGGFDDAQIAHEEPELCSRLRAAGWHIWRIDQAMTLHDAAILRFGQYWKRNRRAGFGLMQCVVRKGWGCDPEGSRILRRAMIWGVALPVATVVAALLWWPLGLALAALYPLQWVRQTRAHRRAGWSPRDAAKVAALLLAGKFAEAAGAIEFLYKRAIGGQMRAIIYK